MTSYFPAAADGDSLRLLSVSEMSYDGAREIARREAERERLPLLAGAYTLGMHVPLGVCYLVLGTGD